MIKLPLILVNFKTYKQSTGNNGLKLLKTCEKVSEEYNVSIAAAPQTTDIAMFASESRIPVFAQHIDKIGYGSNTGFILPEAVKEAGCAGSIVNHSEHRLPEEDIGELVKRLKKLKLLSVLCTKDVEESRKYAPLSPDFIAIEPPELIGSGISVSDAQPEIISGAVEAVKQVNPKVVVLCGAGITKGMDVKKSIELGSSGVLVASGIVKAKDPKKVLSEFAHYMTI